MLTSISKKNPVVKKSCVELAFAEIICKMLQKPNSGTPSVLPKMVPFIKIACHIRKLC